MIAVQIDNKWYDPIQSKFLQTNRWLCSGLFFISNVSWHTHSQNWEWISKTNEPSILKTICWQHIQQKEQVSARCLIWSLSYNFHPNIKLTIEVNPGKLLDTKIILNNEGVVTTQVYQKENEKAIPWVSKILKR